MTAVTTMNRSTTLLSSPCVAVVAMACASILAVALSVATPPAHAQPVSGSSLYYRLGGGSPVSKAANHNQVAMRLGLSAALRLNYSCGKFDIGASWRNLMNGIANLGDQITGAIQAGISALPLYIFQRAQPGLYQLFQTYSQKADLGVGAALKTCEEMEQVIKQGGNPYEQWVKLAKGEAWSASAQAGGDLVQAKVDINKNEQGQRNGVSWVFGSRAGGVNLQPLRPVRDLAVAGYNVTLNKPTATSAAANYTKAKEGSTQLVQAFATPEDLAAWTASVLGDQRIFLCNGIEGCPEATSVATATGLRPKYEAEVDALAPRLAAMADGTGGSYVDLVQVGAPGMGVSPQLMEALRRLPPVERGMAITRLAQEMAIYRTIDRALIARNALIAGLSLPEVAAAAEVAKDMQAKVDRLDRYIDDMMREFRIRKEMTGATALTILGDNVVRGSQSIKVPDGQRADSNPLDRGAVAKP